MSEEAKEEVIESPVDEKLDEKSSESVADGVVAEKKESKPKESVRDTIKKVIKEVKDKTEEPKTEEKEEKQAKKSVDNPEIQVKAPKEVKKEPAIAPHNNFPAEIKSEWSKLDPKVQAALLKREADFEKIASTMDEERSFAKEMQKTILPYMPLINSSQSTPAKAVTELFNYAHILQTGSPQAKGQLLWQLAQRWNADMRANPQVQQQPQYQLQNLQQELQQAKEQLAKLPETIKQQQEKAQLQAVIDAFAADPKNAHYEKVKPVMAALLTSGQAKDMQDAYDKACFADPEIRSVRLAEEEKAKEAKRIAEAKAKADKARNASVSVKGRTGLNGSEPPAPKRSLREDLRANLRAAMH